MATSINDGTGSGFSAKVDAENRLYTRTVNEDEFQNAVRNGRAFNINTEFIEINAGTTAENAIMYVKNNEDNDIVLAAWFVGTDASQGSIGATALGPQLRVYYNPTGGTIVDDASPVAIVNRQGGSSETFDITVYKATGANKTITGQDSAPVLYQTHPQEGRAFGTVYLSLKKGASLGVVYIPNGVEPIQIYTGFQGFISETMAD